MNKYSSLFLPAIFFFIISCEDGKSTKNNIAFDSTDSLDSSKREDSTTLKVADKKLDSVSANKNDTSFLNGDNLKTDDYIKHYPVNQNAELRSEIERLRKEWKNAPNPITAIYQGNDFGAYHHLLFKAANGAVYDFGQAKNNYGQYNLHKLSGQYEDNPEFLGKEFKVYWDWKLSEFLCCHGEYGEAKAYLPSITKLELVKK
ncbi:MAG: hypothetical protein JNJ41_15495 [Bacteroidia bacterium]|nr:hypothetical protein [Bacteroidia bacterium]